MGRMAKQTFTKVIDDISGEEGASTHTFSLNGSDYSIDLAEKNAARLEKALAPFVEKATRASGRRRSSASAAGRKDLAQVREWARKQKIAVSERGRVSKDVLARYDAAH
jgi:nucleoid-associated protein Lsr2